MWTRRSTSHSASVLTQSLDIEDIRRRPALFPRLPIPILALAR